MKKIFCICFLLLATIQLTMAQQTIAVTGTVKDDKGNAVPYAFVRDRPYKYAAYADSVGAFKLNIVPNSYLEVKCNGYLVANLNTGTNTVFQVVLQSNTSNAVNSSSNAQATAGMPQQVFVQHNNADHDNQNFGFGSAMFTAKKEDAHGSKYLLADWGHGFVINPSDSLIQNSNYLYNYDKIGGGLLITQDKASALQVDDKQIRSFTLFDNAGEPFVFEKVPAIDDVHYIQVLAKGKKYAIYKNIKTHFKKADYSSNGLASSGDKFDSYIDESEYYMMNIQTNQLQKFTLKKKALKTVFAAEPDKINKYLTDHSEDIDDAYLSGLGAYMNE